MLDCIRIKAPAKINLFLDITEKKDNGYHNLSSVMQSLDLFDYVTISKNDTNKIAIICNIKELENEENLAYKAAVRFFDFSKISCGINIEIDKRIPSEAGLAGGSSDAAAVLYGLNKMFEFPVPEEDLLKIASKLGADVPFLLKGSTLLCSGIGDDFTEINLLPMCWILIVKPGFGMSTPESFRYYDEHESEIHHTISENTFTESLKKEDIREISSNLFNILEQTASSSEIEIIKEKLLSSGALGSAMTGSGTAVYGIFDSCEKAVSANKLFAKEYSFTSLARPIYYGVAEDNSFKVENKLNELQIPFDRIDHPSVYTMEEMYTLGIFNTGIIGKNLFIRDNKGKRHFLIFVYGDKKVNLTDIENKIGIKHVSFGSAERLYEHLGLTKGSVSPLGVVNNKNADVEFIIDKDFIGCKNIGMHPNQNTSIFWMKYEDLIKLIQSNGNEITFIDI